MTGPGLISWKNCNIYMLVSRETKVFVPINNDDESFIQHLRRKNLRKKNENNKKEFTLGKMCFVRTYRYLLLILIESIEKVFHIIFIWFLWIVLKFFVFLSSYNADTESVRFWFGNRKLTQFFFILFYLKMKASEFNLNLPGTNVGFFLKKILGIKITWPTVFEQALTF